MLQQLVEKKLKRSVVIISGLAAALAVSLFLFLQFASAAATSVTIGTNTKSLDGTNTTRGTNQLVLYTYSTAQTRTPTNSYGIEVAVGSNNVITAVNNRLSSGSSTGTTIPTGGYVLSGHGYGTSTSGYTWLLNNAQVGRAVTLNGAAPTDTTAPAVSLSAPASSSTAVIGNTVNLAATASDNIGVTKVEFLVNGTVVGTDTTSPFNCAWNTSGRSGGNYTITAKAYDAANNSATSTSAVVALSSARAPANTIQLNGSTRTIDGTNRSRDVNELIVYTYSASQTVTSTNAYGIEVAVNANNVITAVNNRLSTGSTTGTTIPVGGYVLSGHGYGTSTSGYTWLVNNAQVGRTVTLGGQQPTVDTTAPQTSITAPANGSSAILGSTVNLVATASDNVAVTKVDFLVNGSIVGSDTTAPYEYAWNTAGKNAGTYTVTTKAYDAAGNTATSGVVQVTLTTTPPSTGDWLSGVATNENGNGTHPAKYFGDWRGTPIEIGQSWPNTPDVWSLDPSVANSWAGFLGPMSLSFDPGTDWKGLQGWRNWSALANGNMDAWWRAAAQKTKEYRQGKGVTYISPFYEFNGDWMRYSVPRTTQGMADFRTGWERVANIWRQEFPEAKMVFPAACSRDVPAAMMPAVSSYDHVGCTIYNAWPWKADGSEAIRLLEVGRQRALSNGKSLVITEWANSGNPNTGGGGGDAPGFIQAMHSYFTQHAGTGPGQLEFETFFNVDGFDLDHIMIRRNGSQIIVNPSQPQTAAKYQQLF